MMQDFETLLQIAHDCSRRYLHGIGERDVMPSPTALEGLSALKTDLPDRPNDPAAVLHELERIGAPATVATTGGRFFGFVVGGALPVTVAASWMASAWDQNAGTWILSPIGAELEVVAAAWLLEILDLPRDASVGFVTGSTMGAFASFAAARSALLNRQGYDVKRRGLIGAPPLRIVTSEELHPTNLAALSYAGFALDSVERCRTDENGRLLAENVPELDASTLVILQAGNINSGSFDDFAAICSQARRAGAWVHIDGAFGLWARASRQKRHLAAGADLADSWSVDGHKWLNLPQDSAIYACRDAGAVQDVFGVEATYLVRDDHRQPNTFTPELSRRARGVEFWAALKSLGRAGVEELVNRCCAHALTFADGLSACGYKVLNKVVLNQVVFACGTDPQTKQALAMIQESGVAWLGPTTWKGRYAMRISVSSWATTDADVERTLRMLRAVMRRVH